MTRDDLAQLSHADLVHIAWVASVALSRYRDHEDKPGFPPGECAWAMGRDLANAFAEAGVEVPSLSAEIADTAAPAATPPLPTCPSE